MVVCGSAEHHHDRPAGPDQGTGGRPAGWHRGADQGHAVPVHHQGNMSYPGCHSGQHWSCHLRRSADLQAGRPGRFVTTTHCIAPPGFTILCSLLFNCFEVILFCSVANKSAVLRTIIRKIVLCVPLLAGLTLISCKEKLISVVTSIVALKSWLMKKNSDKNNCFFDFTECLRIFCNCYSTVVLSLCQKQILISMGSAASYYVFWLL